MSDKQKTNTEVNWSGVILAAILIGLFFTLIDTQLTTSTINSTGVVLAKKLVPPEGNSPYGLVVSRHDEVWIFRVNKQLWEETELLDRFYLTDHQGLISGITQKTTLTVNTDFNE